MKEFSESAKQDFIMVDSAKNGDQKAYAELLKKYRKSIYHTIFKIVKNQDDSEDLAIEVFTKAFKNLNKFDHTYTFSTWLFRIATNHSIDFIRKKRVKTSDIDLYGDFSFKSSEKSPEDLIEIEERGRILREIVEKLPARYKMIVNLRYFKEYSYAEISTETNLPLGTVKANIHRANELMLDLVKNNANYVEKLGHL